MRSSKHILLTTSMLITTLCLAAPVGFGQTTSQGSAVQPDNTKVNQADRNAGAVTADQQKMNATDTKITESIRRSIVKDKTLSTYAHNVKVITQNGNVTLKGPVKSVDEKKAVVAKAVAITGSPDKVTDDITVKQ